VRETDRVVDKTRFSAFIEGSSTLESVLRRDGVETLLVTGTVTNTCCESTARDAMMLNFRVVMISDGNAARTDAAHNAALQNFYLSFGDVMTAGEAESCLRANARAARRAPA
jgi:ureidoacrylate peracid hydrolase